MYSIERANATVTYLATHSYRATTMSVRPAALARERALSPFGCITNYVFTQVSSKCGRMTIQPSDREEKGTQHAYVHNTYKTAPTHL